jgi:hypothetical protein
MLTTKKIVWFVFHVDKHGRINIAINQSLLRHYATSRKVAGLKPDEISYFFVNIPNTSDRSRHWYLFSL